MMICAHIAIVYSVQQYDDLCPYCNRLQCSTEWWFVPILQSFTIVYSVQQYDDLCPYCIS